MGAGREQKVILAKAIRRRRSPLSGRWSRAEGHLGRRQSAGDEAPSVGAGHEPKVIAPWRRQSAGVVGEGNPQATKLPQWAGREPKVLLGKGNPQATRPPQWALVASRRSLPLLGEGNPQSMKPPQWASLGVNLLGWTQTTRDMNSQGKPSGWGHRCPF